MITAMAQVGKRTTAWERVQRRLWRTGIGSAACRRRCKASGAGFHRDSAGAWHANVREPILFRPQRHRHELRDVRFIFWAGSSDDNSTIIVCSQTG